MSHEPRPSLRSDFMQGLFDPDPATRQPEEQSALPRVTRSTMEIGVSDLEPDTALSRTSLPGSPRDTIDVVPERDLLPDEPRITPDSHHPHAPMSIDVEGAHTHHRTGPWLLAAGAVLLLTPIVMSARTPPTLGVDPVVAAGAAAPPLVAPTTSRSTQTETGVHADWDTDLSERFLVARNAADLEAMRARRELALDPVHVASDTPTALANANAAKAAPARPASKAAFSSEQALGAIRAAGVGSAQCGEGAAGATVVSVTFAPSGRVTRALVEDGPLQGTAVGGCIARQLRNVHIAPFDGDFQTLRTDVTLR